VGPHLEGGLWGSASCTEEWRAPSREPLRIGKAHDIRHAASGHPTPKTETDGLTASRPTPCALCVCVFSGAWGGGGASSAGCRSEAVITDRGY
jgi:hypothetical protein